MCILAKELVFSVDEIYTTFFPLRNQVHCHAMDELYIGLNNTRTPRFLTGP